MRRNTGFITNAWPALIVSVVAVAALIATLAVGPGAGSGGGADAKRELVFYCAAGMSEPVSQVIDEYREAFGVSVQVEPAGSGTLLSKIRTTRPELRGDIYLSADRTYIDRARELGLVEKQIPIARIRPVIVVAPGNPKDIRSIDDLLADGVRVVLANPEAASVGRVTKKLLVETGRWQRFTSRVNESSAVSFVGTVNEVTLAIETGAADAGIVWDSVAKLTGLEAVDDAVFAGGDQTVTAALVVPNDAPAGAMHFLRYLTARDRGLRAFAQRGFDIADDTDTWSDRPTLTLMAGAMLKPAIDEAITRFELREGVIVNRIYNGCGLLVAQMKTGAQPDAYFSCDISFMTDVAERFAPPTNVSRNPMVILVRPGNPLGIKTLADLAAMERLAVGLAHPENSALGALTDRLLRRRDLRDDLSARNRVVHSDSGHLIVNQMAVGSLDAAVVYRSNALANPDNASAYELIPIADSDAIATQPFAVSKNAVHPQLTHRLFIAITEAAPRQRFDSLGFDWLLPAHSEGAPE